MDINPNELPDDKLIQNSFKSNPNPAWIYLAIIGTIGALLWGGFSQIFNYQHRKMAENPFLQVTNRDFSLFLWQFPEYMRVNVSSKAGYLPGFQYADKIAIEPGQAEDYVSAPPEVLFLYHTWKRLLGDEFSSRAIPAREFERFLDYSPEWKPDQWAFASKEYKQIIEELKQSDPKSLVRGLPKEVQRAFIGWKNFFLEGDAINKTKPTYKEIVGFLDHFPHYGRPDWRNIVMKGRPDYLKSIFLNKYEPTAQVPDSEMTAFLRVAYFNYSHPS